MSNHPLRFSGAFLCAAALCVGAETRNWIQSDYADFQKGVRTNLSIRSDGRLSLAPKSSEVYDSTSAYLWALAQDSHGNIYTAGGPGANLFRIAPGGKGEKIATFDALEVHAIAIDSKDRVYAATDPDGKIYRIERDGKTTQFYDPKQKYIWALVCDPAGNLFAATGDHGEIHRVTPDGKGEVFFKSDETHVRSIAFDHSGNLIAGTEPGGLVIRISPKGEGFVVYQMPKREVTALAIGPKNEIYAAAAGTKSALSAPGQIVIPAPPPPPAAAAALSTSAITVTPQVAPARSSAAAPLAPATVAGGSDVYLIPSQETPERIWTGAQDIIYALTFDAKGHLIIGAGNKGTLYRLDSGSLYSTLIKFPVEQVTNLLSAKDGTLYAATGNVGKVFRVGPGLETQGTIESDVFDSGGFSTWGRVTTGSDLHGGTVGVTIRSGNLDRPQKNWGPWSQTAEPARFVQWKATLTGNATLDSVDVAYLRHNVAPRIEQTEITPYNYKFPPPTTLLTLSSAATLSLPAIGSKPAPVRTLESTLYPAMTYQKGWLGVRWTASDQNADTLTYTIEIRGSKEKTWRILRNKVHEKYYSFDSTGFADGEYRIRITASDAPSNTPEDALTTTEETDPFTIDNTPPVITGLAIRGNDVRWHAADALSTIYKAEYSLDGSDWTVVDPVGKLSDSQSLDYSLPLSLKAGEHTIAVRVSDENDNVIVAQAVN